ncbi:internal scaffolding protein [Blackfly microvirus SF02]|uniref:Internal scaffolding protein n=1 Tax=Blackfly microvirus SF02 TaxID=2576452 RepID=A0A4V1F5E6_9VIRU|nr:internal scaffolding protein [Blackfly microvirus SF02]
MKKPKNPQVHLDELIKELDDENFSHANHAGAAAPSDYATRAFNDWYIPHEAYGFECIGPSLTRQEFADECDINTIMAQYEATGVITHVNQQAPAYLDLSGEIPDLMEAHNVFAKAETAFMTLPASVRKEFDNDPVKFVEFATKAENVEQMRKWNLAAPATLPDAPREPPEAPKPEPTPNPSKPTGSPPPSPASA